jgi:hypothetical protein
MKLKVLSRAGALTSEKIMCHNLQAVCLCERKFMCMI